MMMTSNRYIRPFFRWLAVLTLGLVLIAAFFP
jgi:hypothetical protein